MRPTPHSTPHTTRSRCMARTDTRPSIPSSVFCGMRAPRSSTKARARCTRSSRSSTPWAIALAGSYWWLVLFYFLLQFASNTAQAPYQGLLPDVVPGAQRGEASGYYGVANLVGIASGTIGAGLLLSHFDRTAAIASIGVVLLTTMLATVLAVPDRVHPTESQYRSLRQLLSTTFGVPLQHRAFLWLMASRLLIFMGFGGLPNVALFYLDNVFFPHEPKATAAATSTLLVISIAVAALVTWPASRLSDRVCRRPLIFVA